MGASFFAGSFIVAASVADTSQHDTRCASAGIRYRADGRFVGDSSGAAGRYQFAAAGIVSSVWNSNGGRDQQSLCRRCAVSVHRRNDPGLGIERWNLHRRIALNIVSIVGVSPRQMVFGLCSFVCVVDVDQQHGLHHADAAHWAGDVEDPG